MFTHGQKFMKKRKKFKNKHLRKNMVSIEQPDIDSIFKSKYSNKLKEGYKALETKEQAIEKNKVDLKRDAEAASSAWVTSYNSASNELRTQQGERGRLLNKLVKDSGDNIWYIDNNGVKRMFETTAAQKVQTADRPDGCPDMTPINISDELLGQFTAGERMEVGYPCKKGCYNVSKDGQTIWVDATGKVHTYSNFGGTTNFKNVKTHSADQIWWDNLMIQSGKGTINDDDANTCGQSISQGSLNDLTIKNNNLISKANDIKNAITSMLYKKKGIEDQIGSNYSGFRNFREGFKEGEANMDDDGDDGDTTGGSGWRGAYVKGPETSNESMKSQLIRKLEELELKRDEIKKLRSNLSTYDGQIEEQKLKINSIKMHHLIWMILGGTFLLTAIINSR